MYCLQVSIIFIFKLIFKTPGKIEKLNHLKSICVKFIIYLLTMLIPKIKKIL